MSDPIKHECGLAVLRLTKPLDYYQQAYGSALWGLKKISLLMEKQHNRGQDAAGLACIRLDRPPGQPYIAIERVVEPSPPWQALFRNLGQDLDKLRYLHRHNAELDLEASVDPAWLKQHYPFGGELFLGHLRYGTHGENTLETAHPFWRPNNWKTRNLVLAGNFNLTNVEELFQDLVDLGQYPQRYSDTVTVMERMGHFLDVANQEIYERYKQQGLAKKEISGRIASELDLGLLLERTAQPWDGGYLMGGLLGHGDLFVLRDPNGIRPGFFYAGEDFVAAASERPALATAFNIPLADVQEIPPGHALTVKRDGAWDLPQVRAPRPFASCSFERIYFSRGNDPDIYTERKELGALLAPTLLEKVDFDLDHTVFGYIPNTSQVAFWGLLKALEDHHNRRKAERIRGLDTESLRGEALTRILDQRVRVENVILKDSKLRTFITEDSSRDEMVGHVYDITYGTVRPGLDTLVCLDDSIVRGTTLRKSILRILSRLQPRKIIIASSAPQIRYPDCYGIDMSRLKDFIVFQAAVRLLEARGLAHIKEETYRRILELRQSGRMEAENCVQAIYTPFSEEEISAEISRNLQTPDLGCEVEVVYQRLADLPRALPRHRGDWYFSGEYPTSGGNRIVNRAYLNYYEGRNARAY